MLDITDSKEKCFAKWQGGCSIRVDYHPQICFPKCPFYKPQGCEDWVRREVRKKIWLIPPDEYFVTPANRK